MSLFPDMTQYQGKIDAALFHMGNIETVLRQLLEQTSNRQPERWSETDSVTVSAAGGSVVTPGVLVPLGKRLILQRIATTAPANSGPCLVYATSGGSSVLDGGNLREVIAVPNAYADAVNATSVIDGGMRIFAQFQTVPAPGGVCTIRFDGQLFDATEPGDLHN